MGKARAKGRAPARPADAAAGAGLVRLFAVQLFDQGDGRGVNWRVIAEILFKAGFGVLDELPEREKEAFAKCVHAGAYARMTGDKEGQGMPPVNRPAGSAASAALGKPPRPHAPR